MGDVADIIKTTYEILSGSQEVAVELDGRNLGMAYAVPKGMETTAAEIFSPWTENSVDNTFIRESAIFGTTLADITMTMSWKTHVAQQYIINAYLDVKVNGIDPTTDVSVKVRFDQPTLFDVELEAYQITYRVQVVFDPVGGMETAVYQGVIRADGFGTFRSV